MKKVLNANHLKFIAIIAMTVDHFADLFYPSFPAQPIPIILHLIGRLTAPIMWFFVCEGFYYTKNLKKYISRMLVLYVTYQNTTLKKWQKEIVNFVLIISAFPADWSSIAALSIVDMYKHRKNLFKQMCTMMLYVLIYAAVSFFFVNKVYAFVCLGVIMVYPLLSLYNGEKGKAGWMKWVFYAYYPAHLVIVGIIRLIMYGNNPILF